MHEVLVNRLGGLSLPRKSVVRLTDRPHMTLDVYRGGKATIQLIFWQLVIFWQYLLLRQREVKYKSAKSNFNIYFTRAQHNCGSDKKKVSDEYLRYMCFLYRFMKLYFTLEMPQ